MFVHFGEKKCPICGDFGKEVEKEIFVCNSCAISFNNFSVTGVEEVKEYINKYWN